MKHCVALFRGINVGGRNSLPMQNLRDILSAVGCDDIRTYIQSGNAVFSTAADAQSLSGRISDAIDERFGFSPQVLLLTADRFREIAAGNPFPAGGATPKHLHVWFLTAESVEPDIAALGDLRAPGEKFSLADHAFYLYAPDGIGRSALANQVERCLGIPATARNWRTVTKLLEMI
jgi:uncharacterized protein (DUF1697 family)